MTGYFSVIFTLARRIGTHPRTQVALESVSYTVLLKLQKMHIYVLQNHLFFVLYTKYYAFHTDDRAVTQVTQKILNFLFLIVNGFIWGLFKNH